jgi:uncharacterized damage-inducible protein DinB
MSYPIHKHLTFNVWANTKVSEILSEVTDEIYFEENKSSFPSIAKTVLHIWGAQNIWLKRMQGESLTAWPHQADQDSKVGQLNGLVQSSQNILDFIKSKDEAFLSSLYSYTNMKGEPFRDSVEGTLFHVVNHSTYHRGQIITMLREAGVTKVVGTDLIHYLRSHKLEG